MKWHRLRRLVFGVLFCLYSGASAGAQSLDWVTQATGATSANGSSFDDGTAIAVDSLGNSYITGTFRIVATFGRGEPNETVLTARGSQDIFVAKFAPDGSLLWARGAGDGGFFQNFAYGIAIDPAGNSYVTGWFGSGPGQFGNNVVTSDPGAFVAKYDPAGTPMWATTLDPTSWTWDIAVDASGNSYVAGATPEPVNGIGLMTFWKVSAQGAKQWTRQVIGVYGGEAIAIAADPTGNLSVTGRVVGGTATFGPGQPNATNVTDTVGGQLFVARYDASGTLIWVRQSPDPIGFGSGQAIATDTAGNSYLLATGITVLGQGEPNETAVNNAFVAKYDSLGNLAWARNVAPPIGQVSGLFGIAHSAAGHIYITGTVFQGVIFIEKYGVDGGLLWMQRLAGVVTDVVAFQSSGISVDGAGNPYVVGTFSGTVRFAPFEPNETFLSTPSGSGDFDVFVSKSLGDTTGQNQPPIAANQQLTTPEDTPLAIVLTATDPEGDPLSYSIVAPPAHGVLSGTLPNLTYTPNPNFHGQDSFTFRASDGTNFSNTATVTITVTPVNDAPVANSQALTTPAGTPIAITLTGQDTDGDRLTFVMATGPSHGTLSGTAPSLTYTPAPNYVGPDSFTFTAHDGTIPSAPATVSIEIGLGAIGCGTLTSGRIAVAGEVDRYSFVGQAGQLISLALASTGGFSANPASTSAELVLVAPSGTTAGVLRTNSQSNFRLLENGTYIVRVAAANRTRTGSYHLNFECFGPVSPDAVSIGCGTLASGQILAAGQVDLLTLSGQAGQLISLALASTAGFSANPASTSVELTLFAPSGAALGVLRSNSQANIRLLESGTHIIRVSAANLSRTGSYNVNLECVVPASPDAVPIACGTLASGQILAAGEVDLYALSGQAGDLISLALASTGGFSANPASTSAELTVFAPSGAAVGVLRSNSQTNIRLAESGTHVIRVSAANLSRTGSYNVNVECVVPVSPDAMPIACGTSASGQIGAAGEVDLHTLSGQAGQVISLALASTGGFSANPASTSAELTLFAPSGAAVRVLRSNSQANITLPEDGTYVVRVSAANLFRLGSYRVTLGCPT